MTVWGCPPKKYLIFKVEKKYISINNFAIKKFIQNASKTLI